MHSLLEGNVLRSGSLGNGFWQEQSHIEMLLGSALKVNCGDTTEAGGGTELRCSSHKVLNQCVAQLWACDGRSVQSQLSASQPTFNPEPISCWRRAAPGRGCTLGEVSFFHWVLYLEWPASHQHGVKDWEKCASVHKSNPIEDCRRDCAKVPERTDWLKDEVFTFLLQRN